MTHPLTTSTTRTEHPLAHELAQNAYAKTDSDIIYTVRTDSRFIPGTLRSRAIDSAQGIIALAGQLKPEYLPPDRKPESLFNQAVLFSIEKGWDIVKAKAWVTSRRSLAAELAEFERINIV